MSAIAVNKERTCALKLAVDINAGLGLWSRGVQLNVPRVEGYKCGDGIEYLHSLRVVRGDGKGTQCPGYSWATL
jgi:hypothetical protein